MVTTQTNKSVAVGVLHPGQMGVTIAAALVKAGHSVYWVSAGRSADTLRRAKDADLQELETLRSMCSNCQYIFSICPPDQSTAVAQQVVDNDFRGTYIDCNAVSPITAQRVTSILSQQGVTCVDGGIIGPPAVQAGNTRLYLSGKSAAEVASLFDNTVVDARVIGDETGAASALKMAYAGWTKGSMALLMTQYALAKQQGVEAALIEEWKLSLTGMEDKLDNACTSSAPKAWRFTGEMAEIAETLEQSGLPRGWFDAATETYQRLDEFKNKSDVDREAVINALVKREV